MKRRGLLLSAGAMLAPDAWAVPLQRRALAFPRDHGSHADARTEWWYLTGRLQSDRAEFGFQLTFFRSRTDLAADLRSAFAPRQVVFAHAALSDLSEGRLHHDQRIAREGFGLAGAREDDAHLVLGHWRLDRDANGEWHAQLDSAAAGFGLDLRLSSATPPLLQGDAGWSRKGPDEGEASFYYSLPQLAASGTLRRDGRGLAVQGRAWLDHEWSESLMPPTAVGWDWIGMNLADGGALTAFRLRDAQGRAVWSGGSLRSADGRLQVFEPGIDTVRFTPGRRWTSPATGAVYPVEWSIATPAGRFGVRARMDAQELDSRASTGSVYWEGLSTLLDEQGRAQGHGYLEMTGYASALRL